MTDLIAEVAEYLDGFLKPGIDPARLAADLVFRAEPEAGWIHIEVPSRYTLTGNPLPASFKTE